MFINPSRRWIPAEPWILLRAGVEPANRVDTQTQQELLQGRVIVTQEPWHRVHAAMLGYIVPPMPIFGQIIGSRIPSHEPQQPFLHAGVSPTNIHQELLFGRIMGSPAPLPERQQPLLHGGRTTP